MSSHEAAFSSESQETQPDISSSIDNVLEDFTDNDEREPNFIDDADKAYIILLNVFQYLPVKDLCSALRVCKVWNRVGSDYVCWKRVNLEDCILHDCNMMGETLKKYGTEILNLSRIRWETNEDSDSESGVDNIMSLLIKTLHNEINEPGRWSSLCNALAAVTTLTEITIVGCPAEAVTLLAEAAPQLKSLSAYRITKGSVLGLTERDSLDVTPIKNMKNLKKLILDNDHLTNLIFDDSSSETTDSKEFFLTDLSINRVINLSCIEQILSSTLVSLELGIFDSLSSSFYEIFLPKLNNLTRLRLQMCQNSYTNLLLKKISALPNLSELELINFEISGGFSKAISECTNLKSLLLIPLYGRNIRYSSGSWAITNTLILNGISKLKNSLKVFFWVITDELIKNTDMLKSRDIINVKSIIGHGDSIPFIAPVVPGVAEHGINIISLDGLQSSLWQHLKFKIFKVSFPATWNLSLHNISI